MCKIPSCGAKVASRGLCRRHLYLQVRYGDPMAPGQGRVPAKGQTCTVDGCSKPVNARGLCGCHYQRQARFGSLELAPRTWVKDQPCLVAGCVKLQRSKGYCNTHYQRWRDNGDPLVVRIAPAGSGTVDIQGYRVVSAIGHPNAQRTGKIKEHRLVMSQMLGRPLLPTENVHHRNGDRLDNRPENLELWVTAQPCGQRIPDLVGFAKEILARYGTLACDSRFA